MIWKEINRAQLPIMEVPLKTYILAPNLPLSSLESNESKMEAFVSAELADMGNC